MNREELIAKIHELGLTPFEEEILGVARPCLSFHTTVAASPIPATQSKLGGMPELPAGVDWPFSQPDVPMVFIGRIVGADLARIHPHLINHTILVFGDWVTHGPGVGKLISFSADTPVFLPETPAFADGMGLLNECDLHFVDALSIPDPGEKVENWRYSEALRTYGGQEKPLYSGRTYIEYPLRNLWASHFDEAADRNDKHRLFGYPIFVQAHPAEYAERVYTHHLNLPEISQADLIQKAAQWESVVSFPTDYTAGLVYGDTGCCGVLVPAADLAAGQFSAAHFYQDMH